MTYPKSSSSRQKYVSPFTSVSFMSPKRVGEAFLSKTKQDLETIRGKTKGYEYI